MSKTMKFLVLPVILCMIPIPISLNEFTLLATAAAALSAAWSAYETRKSGRAALRATEIAEKTLIDSQATTKHTRFQQQFTLLLEQHNQHHAALTTFLDEPEGKKIKGDILGLSLITDSISLIYGHDRCSPYMRVLYHLLRHIDAGYYGENDDLRGKKNYSSLVRSLIRNDVLMLVAVNGCYMNENRTGLHPDFVYYHSLLDTFDFFEHTNFTCYTEVNNQFKYQEEYCKELFDRYFITPTVEHMLGCMGKPESDWDELYFNNHDTSDYYIISVIYTYNNPRHKVLINHINNSEKLIHQIFENRKENIHSENKFYFDNAKTTIKELLFKNGDSLDFESLTFSPDDLEALVCKLQGVDYGEIKYRDNHNTESCLSEGLRKYLQDIVDDSPRRKYFNAPDRMEQDVKLIREGMKQLGHRLGYLGRLRPGGTAPPDLTVKTYPAAG